MAVGVPAIICDYIQLLQPAEIVGGERAYLLFFFLIKKFVHKTVYIIWVSRIVGRRFTVWATREVLHYIGWPELSYMGTPAYKGGGKVLFILNYHDACWSLMLIMKEE